MFRRVMSSILSTSEATRGSVAPTPALFASTEMLALLRRMSSTRPRFAGDVKSALTLSTFRPVSFAIRRARDASRSPFRATSRRSWPRFARRSA